MDKAPPRVHMAMVIRLVADNIVKPYPIRARRVKSFANEALQLTWELNAERLAQRVEFP